MQNHSMDVAFEVSRQHTNLYVFARQFIGEAPCMVPPLSGPLLSGYLCCPDSPNQLRGL